MKLLITNLYIYIFVSFSAFSQIKVENFSKIPNLNLVITDTKLNESTKTKQIMVPSFTINFITQSSLGFSKIKTPTVPVNAALNVVNLAGIQDYLLQQITDEAFQYYIAKLLEAGFTVIERDKYEQNYSYKTLFSQQPDNAEKPITGTLFETNAKLNGALHYKAFSAGNNLTFQFVNVPGNTPKMNKMVKELNTNVADFTFTIDFLEYLPLKKTEKWEVANSMGAKNQVIMDAKPNLFAQYLSANIYTPALMAVSGNNKISASFEHKFYKEIKSAAKTPELEKKYGKGVKIFDIMVDDQAYKEACLELSKKYIDLLVAKIKNQPIK